MKKNEKRKTILCSVNGKKNMNEVSKKKKSLQRYIQEKKINEKKSRKK